AMVGVGFGLTLAVIGNYLSKVRKNYFVGIRTPWTLASDEVWERTHRMGAPICVVGGILICLVCALGQFYLMLPLLLVTGLIPCVYSYFIYRRAQHDGRV